MSLERARHQGDCLVPRDFGFLPSIFERPALLIDQLHRFPVVRPLKHRALELS